MTLKEYGGGKNRERAIVLIVDDKPHIRSVVSEILRNEGLEVETAENVDVAREKFNKLTPDLVLVDIGMPDTDGMTLLKEWKTAENAPPIVITSAYITVATAVKYERAGAYDFLEKPFSIEKLLTTVREALKSHT